jgi:sigma-B regulation protein RsbU (phosphoserine phosphatase)
MFVTVFLGIIDHATTTLSYCNAGHNLPYIISAANGVSVLDGARSKPLGIRPTFTYETATLKLSQGDTIFVFTDGITEALNVTDELFSEERLVEALRPLAGEPAKIVVERVIDRVKEFVGNAAQADDIAAMAIRLVK